MRTRVITAVLLLLLTPLLAGCPDKAAKPKPIVSMPALPKVAGQCGIPKAGLPAMNDCHPPYTYYMLAKSVGISVTYLDWHIGPAKNPVHSGRYIQTKFQQWTESTTARETADVWMYATRSAVFASNGHYGIGCYVAVRDSKGEKVGQDVEVTRQKSPHVYRPYDEAHCIWH